MVLENGSIAAEGTQDELLAHCPLYRDMWAAHIGAKDWAVSDRGRQFEHTKKGEPAYV